MFSRVREGAMLKSLTGVQGTPLGAADEADGTDVGFSVELDHWVVRRGAGQSMGGQAAESMAAHLVDSREIVGAHIEANDGPIGHVDDLLVEDDTGRVRYVVVDPKNWWLGKHVLISPEWIDHVDQSGRTVHVNVDRETIKSAPEYDAGYLLTHEDEVAVFRHYQRRPYWLT
jgi:hypothetical protein